MSELLDVLALFLPGKLVYSEVKEAPFCTGRAVHCWLDDQHCIIDRSDINEGDMHRPAVYTGTMGEAYIPLSTRYRERTGGMQVGTSLPSPTVKRVRDMRPENCPTVKRERKEPEN